MIGVKFPGLIFRFIYLFFCHITLFKRQVQINLLQGIILFSDEDKLL